MKLIRIVLILSLLLSPMACATNQHTVKSEEYVTQIEEEKEISFWDKLKFIGAVCLVGLVWAPEPTESYNMTEMKDGIPESQPRYKLEKERQ